MCFYPGLTGTWHGPARSIQAPELDTGIGGDYAETWDMGVGVGVVLVFRMVGGV